LAVIRDSQPVSRRTVTRLPTSRRLAAAAAVVVALALGAGVGDLVATSHESTPAAAVRSAPVHSAAGTEGTVVLVSSGHTGWLVMTLHDAPTTGVVSCSITLADGSRRDIGRFSLADGYGSWTAPLPVSAAAVRSVSVVDDSGTMVGAARIR
jgi:hypothetical protein